MVNELAQQAVESGDDMNAILLQQKIVWTVCKSTVSEPTVLSVLCRSHCAHVALSRVVRCIPATQRLVLFSRLERCDSLTPCVVARNLATGRSRKEHAARLCEEAARTRIRAP